MYALIADADAVRCRDYVLLAKAAGLEAVTCRDGAAALDALAVRGAPRLLLTELSLPKHDGFALLRALRAKSRTAAVVVVSAFMKLREQAFHLRGDLGIDEMLGKTSPLSSVERSVRRALDKHSPPLLPERRPVREEEAERSRLVAIARMGLAEDVDEQDALQAIAQETAKAFDVPIALVTLTLEHKQRFVAHVGLEGELAEQRGTEREASFCHHVADAGEPLFVPDATKNPTFADNRLVKAGVVRGYAGAPLRLRTGEVIGSLCIIDKVPLKTGADEAEALGLLARRVAGEIELRHQQRQAAEHQATFSQLEGSVAAFAAVLGGIEDGVLLLDHERRIVFANQALATLSGVPTHEIVRLSLAEWVQRNAAQFDDPHEFESKLRVLPRGPFAACETFEIQRPIRRVIRWTAKPVPLQTGVGQLCTYRDVTAEVDAAAANARFALTDALTSLPNRRAAELELLRMQAAARRDGRALCLALLDVDHFKRVNDTHGHATGDRVLVDIAGLLQAHSRPSDLVARWGGEEFLLALPGEAATAREVAERQRAAVAAHAFAHGPVTVSIGVTALLPEEDWATALERADARLYAAKSAGRNRVA